MNPCDQVAMEEREAVTRAQLGGGDGDSDEGARSTELVLWLKSDAYSAPPSQGPSSLPTPTPSLSTHCPKAFPASPTQLCCSCGQVHLSLINPICVPPMGGCWHAALLTGAWPVHPQTVSRLSKMRLSVHPGCGPHSPAAALLHPGPSQTPPPALG